MIISCVGAAVGLTDGTWQRSSHSCHPILRDAFLMLRLNTLQVANLDEFSPITKVADFVTLLGTYSQGFTIIVDPYPEAQGLI